MHAAIGARRVAEAIDYPTAHAAIFFEEVSAIAGQISLETIEALADELVGVRERGGRLFFLGVGGSAANCSHAVNDFRKLCGIEAYAPTDNVSELTARTNDEGWDTVFVEWLQHEPRHRQGCRVRASRWAAATWRRTSAPTSSPRWRRRRRAACKVFGIVGRDGGYTKEVGDVVVVVPTVAESRVTPHAEAFQAVVWHCLVSHPKLQIQADQVVARAVFLDRDGVINDKRAARRAPGRADAARGLPAAAGRRGRAGAAEGRRASCSWS